MHGFSSGSTFLLNAEVDSMGGIVDGGAGIATKPSPRQAAIEKAQDELRVEYDVREERRRELEFLEKGGDPLDFKFAHAASVSVQSTSHTDRHPDKNLISEAKGSFALTASPHGDSVESSGRLGVTTACEPNSADNFDGENEIFQNDRKSMRPGRNSITPLEHSIQVDGGRNVKESENSPIFHPKKGQAYRRRNRSRQNRDDPRSSSADMASRGGHGSSTAAQHVVSPKPVASGNQLETESDGTHVMHSSTSRDGEFAEGKLNVSNSKESWEELQNRSLKMDEASVDIRIVEPDSVTGRDSVDTVNVEHPPSCAEKTEDNVISAQPNETSMINGDNKCTATDILLENATVMMKGLDSGSSCTQTNVSVVGNGNIDSDLCANLKNVDSNETPKRPTLLVGENSVSRDDNMLNEEHVSNAMKSAASCIKEEKSAPSLNGFAEDPAEVDKDKSSLQDEVKCLSNAKGQGGHKDAEIKSESEVAQVNSSISKMESSCPVRSPLMDPASSEVNRNDVSGPPLVLDSQFSTENHPKPLDKAQEDKILEEARMIEAKHKRIAELSISLLAREYRPNCHWDLVLEEMAWLANDFAQERVWKVTAAAQICRRAAFASRIRLQKQNQFSNQRSIALTLANAVMEFWHSARLSIQNVDSSPIEKCKHQVRLEVHELDKASQDELQSNRRKQDPAVKGYAVRFLQFNGSPKPFVEGEVSRITDVLSDVDIPEVSWQDQFTEENLFYAVPPGAMEMYRTSIESHLAVCERIGNNIQEEVDTSGHDVADCAYEDNDYEEDEGENLYYPPGALDTGKASKKKRKLRKSYEGRSYEYGGDFGYGHSAETRNGTPQLNVMGKRPTNSLHVDPIPTKRMRTASRQRVVSPFGAGPASFAPVLSKAEASSGDTNSFQDDISTLHGGPVVPRGSEVDSTMNFEKQSTYDSVEMSTKPKKKKKVKHQSGSYDQRWQLDSSMQNEQKDFARKRLDNHQLESNGNGGLFGHHAKKPKLTKQLDSSFDNTAPMSGSVASPVASQMSNMSSQTKIIKFIGGRDRAKKGKGLKVSNEHLGSGSAWTIVEDQALVVLVHDMGPNWELVSDAINNILQFKCIFRKPQDCKERHKFLMDRPSGDGADSAEDSGSSQPYPSTLPGIPKGSARQLFRSLHAHVEEDNIKSRFEKIIHIEQQLHFRKKKFDNQELKQRATIHSSHVLSLSQVIPNNVNGGVLTPLDLCDTSNQEPLSSTYSHAALSNQSSIPQIHSPGGVHSPLQGLQGSPGMGIVAPPPSHFSGYRDGRYSIPRSGSLSIEEQQRLPQYNSTFPGRNAQASTPSPSGSLSGSERGVRMHPGGNGAGMMPGMNRSMPMTRPGVQGTPLPNMGGNAHPGTALPHGNTMFKTRDSSHVVRPGQSSDYQQQLVLPEMQIKQTNSPGGPPFGGPGSGFSSQTDSSPLPAYPGHHPHVLGSPSPEQQAYLRIARERQMKHRLLQRQHQQQLAASTALMTPRVQTPSQLPSCPATSPMTHVGPPPHQQQKNLQGHGRSAQSGPGGTINQGGKQRYQQSGRQHPQQREHTQSQQTKLMKGVGRSNMVIHQNLPIDATHLNGISANTASQVADNLYSGSSLSPLPLSKPQASPQSSNQTQSQKPYVNVGPATSKPQIQGVPSPAAAKSNQAPSSSLVHSRNHHQSHLALQRTSQVNSGSLTKSHVNHSHSQAKQKSPSVGPPSACINSANAVAGLSSSTDVRNVEDPVSDSAMTIVSTPSNPSQAVTYSLVNNSVSHGHESQWQQQESQINPPLPQPILPHKQSQQNLQLLEHSPPKVLQSQSQPTVQDGQNPAVTKTTNSRLN